MSKSAVTERFLEFTHFVNVLRGELESDLEWALDFIADNMAPGGEAGDRFSEAELHLKVSREFSATGRIAAFDKQTGDPKPGEK